MFKISVLGLLIRMSCNKLNVHVKITCFEVNLASRKN